MSKSEHFFFFFNFSLNRSFKIVMCGHAGLNLGCEQSISVTHQPPQDSCSLCGLEEVVGGGWRMSPYTNVPIISLINHKGS